MSHARTACSSPGMRPPLSLLVALMGGRADEVVEGEEDEDDAIVNACPVCGGRSVRPGLSKYGDSPLRDPDA